MKGEVKEQSRQIEDSYILVNVYTLTMELECSRTKK